MMKRAINALTIAIGVFVGLAGWSLTFGQRDAAYIETITCGDMGNPCWVYIK